MISLLIFFDLEFGIVILLGFVDKDIAKGNIEFKNVRFGYSDDKVIINASFKNLIEQFTNE